MLLFYGWIHENITNDNDMIYNRIPYGVILICIQFDYSLTDICYDGDIWNKSLMNDKYGYNVILSDKERKLSWMGNNAYQVAAFGSFEITKLTIRKLWRIRVLQKKYADHNMQSTYFRIGVAMKSNPKDLCYQIEVNGSFSINALNTMVINADDIISLLYTRNIDQNLNGEIKFAVNGFQVIQRLEIPSNGDKILSITMFDPCFDLQLLK